jgi:predicted transcriptional regulator
MSKAILISIKPKWCELIASGKKTVEVRKTKPKLGTPFKCYIYCTKDEPLYHSGEKFWCKKAGGFGNGKVIGEFVCKWIRCEHEVADGLVDVVLENTSCVSARELVEYANGKVLYSWHISDLVIYDKPKELREFYHACTQPSGTDCAICLDRAVQKCWRIARPPQSWCYVEEDR